MTTTTTSTGPQTVTFPRSTIAALSPHSYLLAHLNPSDPSQTPIRPNGRTPSSFRTPSCTTNSLTHCVGSAVVRLGDTAVVCGIQAEILLASSVADPPRTEADSSASDLLASLNLLVPNVELATGCSPAHMPGGAPSTEAQALAQRLYTLVHSSCIVDVDDLRILHTAPRIPGDSENDMAQQTRTIGYWTLYASVHVLSLSGSSSLIDAAWAALLAALRDVRLPHAWWDVDLETVVCSDRLEESRTLRLNCTPLCCTWGVFVVSESQLGQSGGGGDSGVRKHQDNQSGFKTLRDGRKAWILADPDSFEDPLCHETITVVVDGLWGRSKLLKIEKSGGSVLGVEDISELTKVALARWREWSAVLPQR